MLLKPGVYEVTVADMLLPALSHALGLDILIFNTFKASRSFSGGNGPLLLSQSDCWGGEASKKPPPLIAYNGVHYEQLKPKTKRDEFLTKNDIVRPIILWLDGASPHISITMLQSIL